ncbi:MAG: hypothetical protein IJE08_12220 [Clostridia bacterium]|nr:hypothetical protein [Clostridia bacterium]
MSVDRIRERAGERAQDFLLHEQEYMLGFVEAEQSNPLTRGLGEAARRDAREAVEMIFCVDRVLADTFARCVQGEEYREFAARVEKTLREGGRLVLSGCGATGRLALNLEASWRRAAQRMAAEYPQQAQLLRRLEDQVVTIMTGGDYALIKSVECFEDYAELGARQTAALNVGEGDLLIGVTATAETTSILGTALAAAKAGAKVQMVVCSNPEAVSARLTRAREVFEREGVYALYLPCGAMAVTGSTRMQSSSIEQLSIASAMEEALVRIVTGKSSGTDYAKAFTELMQQLLSDQAVAAAGDYAAFEAKVYEEGGLITYFADEYLLDVLSDTTERSPTFVVPPFVPEGGSGEPSWAFVKDPQRSTEQAWRACLMHEMRCISWTKEDYESFGVKVDPVPKISAQDLLGYRIGCEEAPAREGGTAVWIGEGTPCPSYGAHAGRYAGQKSLTLEDLGVKTEKTSMKLFEHLAIKIVLNTISTVSMGRMGRLTSNFMTWLNMSNKKLIDRSTRLIMQESGLTYEEALYELMVSDEEIAAGLPGVTSPAQRTISRLLHAK